MWKVNPEEYNKLSSVGKKVFHSYLENCSTESVQFRFTKKKAPIDGNKIGGEAYLPLNALYPYIEDVQGRRPMALLCQLNLEEIPPMKWYPQKGILQFYIDPLSCGELDKAYYKVIYIANPTKDFSQLATPPDYHLEYANLPFKDEYEISFEKAQIPITNTIDDPYDFFDEMLKKACSAIGVVYADLSQDDLDVLGSIFYFEISGICEYPSDINGIFISPDYPKQVLQIASERMGDEWIFLFLDCGVAHFFLPEGALEKTDFSDVSYFCSCG